MDNLLTHPSKLTQFQKFTLLSIITVGWLVVYSSFQPLANWFTYNLIALFQSIHLNEALVFFFYDVAKIMLVISGLIFLISLGQTFIENQKDQVIVERSGENAGNIMSSPFYSCSYGPIFNGSVPVDIRLGKSFSFLITFQLMGKVAFCIFKLELFGWKVHYCTSFQVLPSVVLPLELS